jgi:hypothetical protein
MRVVARREQRCGAVLAPQAQLQGLHPGGGGVPVAFRGPFLLAQLLEGGFEPVEVGGGLLVSRVEVLLARLLGGDRRLQRSELALGLGGAQPSGLDGRAHPADLPVGGLDPGRLGRHLPGQPGQAFAAVGDRAGDPSEALLFRRVRLLDVGPGGHGGLECGRRVGDLDDQRLVLREDLGRLAPQLLGVAAGRARARVVRLVREILAEQPDALRRQRPGCGEPLGQAGERIPAVLRLGELGPSGFGGGLQLADAAAEARQALLDLGAARDEGGLVGHLLLEGGGELDEVVGQQPEPSVAHLGLDRGRLARGVGLPTERAELAPDLAGEVGDPGEVGLHRLELAQRALLALAVFEDSGRLLDEAASLLRRRA